MQLPAYRKWREPLAVIACVGVAAFLLWPKPPLAARADSRPITQSRLRVQGLAIQLTDGSPGKGAVFEAFDYLCPPCHEAQGEVDRLRKGHPKLAWGLLPFPLHMHPGSFEVALAGYRATERGNFADFYDSVMSSQALLGTGPTSYFASARPSIRLDWLQRHVAARKYIRTLNAIKALPIDSTPSFLAFNRAGACMVSNSPEDAIAFASK